ncbi:MAG: CoA transferase [Pseudomonadota bacterium]|nr:CoA transferase [Pseudomonadota bacterium]
MSFGTLSDIRIIDLTQMLAGPYGTMMLADHGAEVIKVESPHGDMTRPGGPFHPDDQDKTHGGYFQSVNRNKKSIVLDLKTESGRDALKTLIKDADAITENFRAGVMDKLGLSYETLREINPKLVYGTLRGFGDQRTGASPYVEWPAFDVVAQAMGGIMGITGPDAARPTKIGPGVGDIVPGMMLAFGVLSAIHHARRTGQGQFVDVSMVDSMLAVCERMIYQHSVSDHVARPQGNGHPFMCPFGMFPAKDGHVTIAAPQQAFFDTLCDLIDVPALKDDPRFNTPPGRSRHKDKLEPLLAAATCKFTKDELTQRLGGKIPYGPVLQMDEIDTNPHFAARDMVVEVEQPGSARRTRIAGVPIKMTETPGGVHSRGPYLGEHTEDILREAGISDRDIEQLKAAQAA